MSHSDKFCCGDCEKLYSESPEDQVGSVTENGHWYGLYLSDDDEPATIVSENCEGFVSCDQYESDEEAQERFKEISEEVNKYYSETL